MLTIGRKTKGFIVFHVGMMITLPFGQQLLTKMFTMAVEIRMLVNQIAPPMAGLFFCSGFPWLPCPSGLFFCDLASLFFACRGIFIEFIYRVSSSFLRMLIYITSVGLLPRCLIRPGFG